MSTSAEQIVRNLPPGYLEQYYKNMAATLGGELDAQGNVITPGLMQQEYNLPAFEIAGLTPAQLSAVQMGLSGVGSYLPRLQAGEGTLAQGIGGYQQAMDYARAGEPYFASAGQFTQSALNQASPYQQLASNVLQNAILGGQQQALAGQQAAGSAASALGGYGARGAGITGQAAQNILGQAGAGQQNILGAVAGAMPYQQAAMGRIGQAADIVGGSARAYDPQSYQQFMDPYTESVIRQAEQDISRQGAMQAQGIRAQATGAGAFGGSREAIAQRELGRNVGEQQARTAAGLRSQGFQQAQQQAQTAFESQQRRQQQAGQLFGQLGQATGALGTQFGQLGLQGAQAAGQMGMAGAQQAGQMGLAGQQFGAQTAQQMGQLGLQGGQLGMQGQQLAGQLGQGLGSLGTSYGALGLQGAGQLGSIGGMYGQLGQGLGALSSGLAKAGLSQAALGEMAQAGQQRDINALLSLGALEQGQRQSVLDAYRQTATQAAMFPYQRLGFMSDILRGVPSSQGSFLSSYGAQPSTMSQLAGGIMGIYGLSQTPFFNQQGQ